MAERASFDVLSTTADNAVLCNGNRLHLTRYEEVVLAELIRGQTTQAGMTSRMTLQNAVESAGAATQLAMSNSLEVVVSRVRKKLLAAGCAVKVRSVRSRGYMLHTSTETQR